MPLLPQNTCIICLDSKHIHHQHHQIFFIQHFFAQDQLPKQTKRRFEHFQHAFPCAVPFYAFINLDLIRVNGLRNPANQFQAFESFPAGS